MKRSTNTKTSQTSQRAVDHHETASTLQALRALQPNRLLTWTEASAIAARQANRLRARHEGNHEFGFDAQIIADQPRLHISLDSNMAMAGSSHWTGSHWQILLNEDDHPLRRRFTLAHEYKHIIDHGRPVDPELEERICDHFAACLLMPKAKVIAAWTGNEVGRSVTAMAQAFAVSQQAMRYRLNELGLLDTSTVRCGNVRAINRRPLSRNRSDDAEDVYYRQAPTRLARVA